MIDVLLGTHSWYQCPFNYWFILQELLIFHVYWFLNYNICILVQTICNQLDIQEKLNVYIQQELFYNHVLGYIKLQSSKFRRKCVIHVILIVCLIQKIYWYFIFNIKSMCLHVYVFIDIICICTNNILSVRYM